MSGHRKRSISMTNPIYAVPELTGIVGIVGYHIHIKVRFSFIHESIAELALF